MRTRCLTSTMEFCSATWPIWSLMERNTMAELLAHIAEVDARKLYLPAAFPSMLEYCVGELRLFEDSAFKRIRAARAARRFPAIFEALADGRLHLTAVVRLAPHLTEDNAAVLLADAEHLSKSELELMLARHFPRPELPTEVRAIGVSSLALSAELVVPEPVMATEPRPRLVPLSPRRFGLQLTMDQATHDKLCYAQALLGHSEPSGDIARVFGRALDSLIRELEKTKFAATSRPRRRPRRATAARTIPASVKRAVWERDQGQCSFVSDAGQRCPARTRLEFDHLDPVARGGAATVDRVRLACRAHNQYEAECVFGTEFMQQKRQESQRAQAEARRARKAREAAAQEVIPALRALGLKAGEAREAAALCEAIPDASFEDRLRRALSYCLPRVLLHGSTRRGAMGGHSPGGPAP